MEEERKTEDAAQDNNEAAPDARDDVSQEVNRLVEEMVRAARSAWKSGQRHQLEANVRSFLGALVGNLEEALTRFGQSEQGQEVQEQAAKVANQVRESALAVELKSGLTKGLKTAANEVQKFADTLEEGQARADSPQDIPVKADDDADEGKRE